MDFHQQDIRQFLLEAIPFRFRQLSPPEFEDFIRYLFEVDGYALKPQSHTGEFGGLILAQKEDITLIIIALRKSPEEILGEEIIRKANRAREFFSTDQSWIITTSSFTPESRLIAEEFDIELWDWDALYGALCQLFFEGKSHLEYLEIHSGLSTIKEMESELKLKVKWQAAEGVGTEWFNLGLTVTNPSERNIYLHLELPALIDHQRNQVIAEQWVDDEFVAGMIYAGASVRTNALFSVDKLGDRPPGGRIVMTCHERLDVPVTYHLQAKLQGQACFIVTYCYTSNSPEYKVMTAFRDEVLSKSKAGRLMISLYYYVSPLLVTWAARNHVVDWVLKKAASCIVPWFMKSTRSNHIA